MAAWRRGIAAQLSRLGGSLKRNVAWRRLNPSLLAVLWRHQPVIGTIHRYGIAFLRLGENVWHIAAAKIVAQALRPPTHVSGEAVTLVY